MSIEISLNVEAKESASEQRFSVLLALTAIVLSFAMAAFYIFEISRYDFKGLNEHQYKSFYSLLSSLEGTVEGENLFRFLSNDFYQHINNPKTRHYKELLSKWATYVEYDIFYEKATPEFKSVWCGPQSCEAFSPYLENLNYEVCYDDQCHMRYWENFITSI